MKFEARYYAERLTLVNPEGDVGVVTLWSKVDSALNLIRDAGVDLSRENSRIAVVANLYGNGLQQMLRNLLWNPQIRYLVIVGKNLAGSREWLTNFFSQGLEEVEFLGAKSFRILGTDRNIDGGLLPHQFGFTPKFEILGDVGDVRTKESLATFFEALPIQSNEEYIRVEPPPIPEPTITRFPSEPRSHTIVRSTPMEAWRELIFRLHRFGYRTQVAKKTGLETRTELLNVHVVIQDPVEESEEVLAQYGFSLNKFQDYQRRFLDPVKPEDLDYTYGNRLRGYFESEDTVVDSPQIVAERLKNTPDSRHCYISLWDNHEDLPMGTKCPCFVSAFFRVFDGRLNLTATFRTHNAMDAWPENVYGLIALQRFVAEKAGLPIGPITVFSHSISIDPSALDKAKRISEDKKTDQVFDPATKKFGPRMDENGAFTVTFDKSTWELVVEHSLNGMKIGEYRGKTSEEIELQLARDVALSQISHALYLGRELARKESVMKLERAKSHQSEPASL